MFCGLDFRFRQTLTRRTLSLFLFSFALSISSYSKQVTPALIPLIAISSHRPTRACQDRDVSIGRDQPQPYVAHARARTRLHRRHSTPVIIGMYNETNKSSTDMSLSACICQSLVYRLRMRKFYGARDRLDTTYYVFRCVMRMCVYVCTTRF